MTLRPPKRAMQLGVCLSCSGHCLSGRLVTVSIYLYIDIEIHMICICIYLQGQSPGIYIYITPTTYVSYFFHDSFPTWPSQHDFFRGRRQGAAALKYIFWAFIWPLRASGAHWARRVPGWGPVVLTAHWARRVPGWGPAVLTKFGRSQLRSSGAHWARKVPGWGPAVPSAFRPSQLRSSSAHCVRKLAKWKWTWT